MTTTPAPRESTPDPGRRDPVSRVMVGAIVLVVLIAAVLIGSALLPRWWAQRIGDQVDGSMVRGIVAGLFYGFVFTVLPVVVLRWTFRRRRTWKLVAWMLGLAALLAVPNLLTLSIVVGSGNAAHAGERILDVDGPGFRYATAAGALAAVGLWVWAEAVLGSRRRSQRRVDELRGRLEARPPTPAPSEPPVPDDGAPR